MEIQPLITFLSLMLINASTVASGEPCECVSNYQCDSTGHIISDGEGLIDVRVASPDKRQANAECENPDDVCCTLPGSAKMFTSQAPHLPARKCGTRSNPSILSYHSRILNHAKDGATKFGEYPWQVAILRSRNGRKLFLAGGVLINDLHILTAAHKVSNSDPSTLTIRVGAWNLTTDDEPFKFQDLRVDFVLIHPKFNKTNLFNDIAVIVLAKKVSYAENVENICLPDRNQVFEDFKCVSTGWGKNALENGKHSTVLKQVKLPMVDSEVCQQQLRNTRLGKFFVLDQSFLCAGGEEDLDACVGDGGGPLMCQIEDGTFVLVGLVAWGIDCGLVGVPGVYVNVPYFLDWIASHTRL